MRRNSTVDWEAVSNGDWESMEHAAGENYGSDSKQDYTANDQLSTAVDLQTCPLVMEELQGMADLSNSD